MALQSTRSRFVTPQKYEYRTVLTHYGTTGEVLGELDLGELAATEKRISVLPDGKYLLMWGGYHGWGLARVLPFASE